MLALSSLLLVALIFPASAWKTQEKEPGEAAADLRAQQEKLKRQTSLYGAAPTTVYKPTQLTQGFHERGEVFGLAFSPDGTRLASAGEDNILRLWSRRQTG